MKVLRTPDERFSGLPGYDFSPHYVEVAAGDGSGMLRVHHLDEGTGRRARRPSFCCTASRPGATSTAT